MRQHARASANKENQVERARRRLPAIQSDWLVAFFVLCVLACVVTDGDWDLFSFRPSNLEEFFDGQAQSLLHGRIDVPLEAIKHERFVRNGKFYGYFGPTPALARMPLTLLFPGMYGRWSRLSMLLGSLAGMAVLILLFRKLEKLLELQGKLWALLRASLIVAVFLGSTNLFISTESRVYQEAIMWASALTLAHAVFLVCYLLEPKTKWLALSCAAAFLAFNAKISSGAGTLVSLLLVDAALLIPFDRFREYWGVPRPSSRRNVVLVITLTLVASASSWAGLNYWKYGLVFTSQPLHLTPHPDPERLRRIKGDPFSLNNIPLMLSVYLSPANIRFRPAFPWAYLLPADPKIAAGFPSSHFDGIEPVASLTASMPILFVGALAGMAVCFLLLRRPGLRVFRAPLLGVLAGTFLILGWGYISYRFLHDALPWLALGSAIAIAHVPLLRSKSARIGLTSLLIIGAAYGVWVNLAYSAIHKRNDSLPESDTKRVAFFDFAQDVTSRSFAGAFDHLRHWRTYIPAAEFQRGNVTLDNTLYSYRLDISVIWYEGPPPGFAEYNIEFPKDGLYEISLLYASPDSRPLRLLVEGKEVLRSICAAPTGGPYVQNERWSKIGAFRIPAGRKTFTLVSDGKFPVVRMIRIVEID